MSRPVPLPGLVGPWWPVSDGAATLACYRAGMDSQAVELPESPAGGAPPPIAARWLGRIGYREAWALQQRLAAARADGRIGDQLLLLEHPAVLTLGRHADDGHVLAPPAELARGASRSSASSAAAR